MSSSHNKPPHVGIDMVVIARFTLVLKKQQTAFLEKVFFASEIKYCMSHKNKAPHFAGLFAAKEAVSKALGTSRYPFAEIEVRHKEDGAPEAYHKGKRLSVTISITHTKTLAASVAVGY
jgi:phosphopantetheine--protein transferase-like protein